MKVVSEETTFYISVIYTSEMLDMFVIFATILVLRLLLMQYVFGIHFDVLVLLLKGALSVANPK